MTHPFIVRDRTPVRLVRPVLAAAGLALLAACAGTPPPVAQMAVAEAAVKRAGSASTTETAAAELRVATDKLAAARSALLSGDNDRARQLAEQAAIDAQVAELHAQSMRSTKAAQETQDAARVLREEIARKTPR